MHVLAPYDVMSRGVVIAVMNVPVAACERDDAIVCKNIAIACDDVEG